MFVNQKQTIMLVNSSQNSHKLTQQHPSFIFDFCQFSFWVSCTNYAPPQKWIARIAVH